MKWNEQLKVGNLSYIVNTWTPGDPCPGKFLSGLLQCALHGASVQLARRLPLVEKAGVQWLKSDRPIQSRITPILHDLHWLFASKPNSKCCHQFTKVYTDTWQNAFPSFYNWREPFLGYRRPVIPKELWPIQKASWLCCVVSTSLPLEVHQSSTISFIGFCRHSPSPGTERSAEPQDSLWEWLDGFYGYILLLGSFLLLFYFAL